MGFTRAQQPEFQALRRVAFSRSHAVPADESGFSKAEVKEIEDRWYRDELEAAVGERSTKDLNAGRDYDRVMAHFEELAGQSIKWQMRLHSGDARRVVHEVRRVCAKFEVDDDYMMGIARSATGRALPVKPLEEWPADMLLVVLRALKIQVRRQLVRGQDGATIRKREVEETEELFPTLERAEAEMENPF